MKEYKYLLFDLDGTITNPGLGITNSVKHALEKLGITITDQNELTKFIGPPLWDSFEKYYGLSKEEAERAVHYYREYYNRSLPIFRTIEKV
jgi:phosphoglycolate phosphatase